MYNKSKPNPINKKLLALFLSTILLICSIPSIVFADDGVSVGQFTVDGGALDEDYTFDGTTLTVISSKALKITNSVFEANNGIAIKEGTEANITIENLRIRRDNYSCAFAINKGATLNLTLEGENYLSSGRDQAGIGVYESTLVITDESTGQLTAIGQYLAAGIGGSDFSESEGTIIINGGTIVATGNGGSGIGSGYPYDGVKQIGDGYDITINGGNVTAYSDLTAIGGGSIERYNKSVTINGGVVIASGGDCGIGDLSDSFKININGGLVESSAIEGNAFSTTPVLSNYDNYGSSFDAYYGKNSSNITKINAGEESKLAENSYAKIVPIFNLAIDESGTTIEEGSKGTITGKVLSDSGNDISDRFTFQWYKHVDRSIATPTNISLSNGEYSAWTELEDGTYKSGNTGIDNTTSIMTADYEVQDGEGIEFSYIVSSEEGYDYFDYRLTKGDETIEGGYSSGENSDKILFENLEAGNYQLELEYKKDMLASAGNDCAIVDLTPSNSSYVYNEKIDGATKNTYTVPSNLGIGTYTYELVANLSGYTFSTTVDVTVVEKEEKKEEEKEDTLTNTETSDPENNNTSTKDNNKDDESSSKSDSSKESPKTGNTSILAAFATFALASGAVIFLSKKKYTE